MRTAVQASAEPGRGGRWRNATLPVAPAALAPVGRRVGVLLLDQAVTVSAAVLLLVGWLGVGLPTGRPLLVALAALVVLLAAVQTLREAVTGATIGAAVLGVRTVGAATGLPAGLIAVLVRRLVLLAGFCVGFLGGYVVAASGTWDTGVARRGWHDKAAGTMVLAAWAVPTRAERAEAARAGTRTPPAEVERGAGRGTWTEPVLPVRSGAAVSVRPRADEVPTQLDRSSSHRAVRVSDAPVGVAGPVGSPARVGAEPSGALPGPPRADGREVAASTSAIAIHPVAPVLVERGPEPAAGTPRPAPVVRPRLPEEVELTRLTETEQDVLLAVPRLRLEFDTGERVDVVGDGAVGRDPAFTTGGSAHHQISIADPERSVSRLHLLFGPDGSDPRLWVTDAGSTNGTVLVDPEGMALVLTVGVRAVVGDGWQIRFGGRRARVVAVD
jgi:hypothetical protein